MNEKISDMFQRPFVVTSIDGLTTEQRRAKYDTHKCGRCGIDHKPEFTGWYVSKFESYSSTAHYCPECIVWHEQEWHRKQSVLKSLPDLEAALDARRKALTEFHSRVERDEHGVLHYESSYDGEPITIQTLVDAFQEYEAQEPEIIKFRKALGEIRKERESLKRLHEETWIGSGFRPRANT